MLVQSCTIQKRRYLKGFHVQRWQSVKTMDSSPGESTSSGIANTPVDMKPGAEKNAETNDTPGVCKTLVNNTTHDLLLAYQQETKNFSLQEFKNNDFSRQNIPSPVEKATLHLSQKTAREGTKKNPDGWGVAIAILIVMIVLFPGFLGLLSKPIWLGILSLLLWIAVDIFIILYAPTVLAMILYLLLWNIVFFLLFRVLLH